MTSKESAAFNTGVETWLHKSLGLRFGAADSDFNFGVSVLYNQFHFDYAFVTDELEKVLPAESLCRWDCRKGISKNNIIY